MNKQIAQWSIEGVELPSFDVDKMTAYTKKHPVWVHFGAGNIFRGFIASLQQDLLNAGLQQSGIIASDTFDYEIIDKIYKPFDNKTLLALMHGDGSLEKKVVASVAEAVPADSSNSESWSRLVEIFKAPSLQMVSFTITEKGYALCGMDGKLMPVVEADMANGPAHPKHAMAVVTSLALTRFLNGAHPVAFASMDNCSHNGEKLEAAVMEIANAWVANGFADKSFVAWLSDKNKVAFPWSMIDKITPRPSPVVQQKLEALGFTNMSPVITSKKTYIAPFVNAEVSRYLVIEDTFPNGRPQLEKAGVYMTDRNTVNRTETMKVTTCLNPLHTALAVYGCMTGYTSIAAEMQNETLVKLIKKIGYDEGLPVVVNPGILNPKDFIDEVVNVRLPNPNIPDTPQRIASDTSQKIPVRYGETIKSYIAEKRDLNTLIGIPLAIAGWLRYLLAKDDNGAPFELSPDPMIPQVQPIVQKAASGEGDLHDILSNKTIFGTDLYTTPLAGKIEALFKEECGGNGAVMGTLKKHLK